MVEANSDEQARSAPVIGGRIVFYRRALVAYLLLLVGVAIWSAMSRSAWDALNWKPDSSNWLIQTAGQLAVFSVRDFLLFTPLAFLAAVACCPSHREVRLRDLVFVWILGALLSLILALFLKAIMAGLPLHAPSIIVMMFLAIVCLGGSWAGATWGRSRSIVGWLACQLVSVSVVIPTVLFSLAWFGLEQKPIDIVATTVDTKDRVRLVDTFRQHDPRDLATDETTELKLTERDFNQLLAWGFSLLPGDQRAVMEIDAERVAVALTGKLPTPPVFNNVVNVRVAGRPITKSGELGISPLQLRIGRVRLPEWLLKLSGPMMIDKDWHNATTRPFFSALRGVDVGDGEVTVAYGHLELPDGFVRDSLVGIGAMEDIAPAAGVHAQALLTLASETDQLTFGQCMQTAFASAEQRSAESDPVHQNRAAILALGYVLGHSGLRKLVGPELPEVPRDLTRKFRSVSLRQRGDWTRHYTLSAALEVLSNKLASHAIGVLKEELDSDGGSGFSFGDLLADRSGTALAVSSSRSPEAALAMQARLAAGFDVDDFMPEGADLPEGLQHGQFLETYGGIEDPRYKAMLREIDGRVDSCAAYQQ